MPPAERSHRGERLLPAAWQTASELVLTFMKKYLGAGRRTCSEVPAVGRPFFRGDEDATAGCALKVRWDDPVVGEGGFYDAVGEVTLGSWSEGSPW